jgi:hypothetical protein
MNASFEALCSAPCGWRTQDGIMMPARLDDVVFAEMMWARVQVMFTLR